MFDRESISPKRRHKKTSSFHFLSGLVCLKRENQPLSFFLYFAIRWLGGGRVMVYWNQPKGLTTDGCYRWAQASQLCVEAWRDRKVRNGVVGKFMWYKAAYVFLHAYVIWSLQWDIISMEMRQRASQRSVCEWSLPKWYFWRLSRMFPPLLAQK